MANIKAPAFTEKTTAADTDLALSSHPSTGERYRSTMLERWTNYFKVKTGFNANREHGNTEPSKEADLLFFYADWCPHCKTAKPEWDALKKENEGKVINGYSVIYTEYNCVNPSPELEDLMNKYEIKGYPTIKLIKDGQVIDYDAKPTTSTLNQFLTQVL